MHGLLPAGPAVGWLAVGSVGLSRGLAGVFRALALSPEKLHSRRLSDTSTRRDLSCGHM